MDISAMNEEKKNKYISKGICPYCESKLEVIDEQDGIVVLECQEDNRVFKIELQYYHGN